MRVWSSSRPGRPPPGFTVFGVLRFWPSVGDGPDIDFYEVAMTVAVSASAGREYAMHMLIRLPMFWYYMDCVAIIGPIWSILEALVNQKED